MYQKEIGENGTLIVPTFTYSISSGQKYDYKNSKNICGIFSEYIRKKRVQKFILIQMFLWLQMGVFQNILQKNRLKIHMAKIHFLIGLLKKKGKSAI